MLLMVLHRPFFLNISFRTHHSFWSKLAAPITERTCGYYPDQIAVASWIHAGLSPVLQASRIKPFPGASAAVGWSVLITCTTHLFRLSTVRFVSTQIC